MTPSTDSHQRGGSGGGARDVARTYERLAAVYDLWAHLTEGRSLARVLERAAIRDGDAVLEVAVGTGLLFRELVRRNPHGRNVGVDLTDAMLRRARRKAQQVGGAFEMVRADARALPFDAGRFDAVLSTNVLGLLPASDVSAALGEMRRVLRPGGRLVVAAMTQPAGRLPAWAYRVGAVWLGAWREVSLEPAVRGAGFGDVRRELVAQLGMPTEIVAAVSTCSSSG